MHSLAMYPLLWPNAAFIGTDPEEIEEEEREKVEEEKGEDPKPKEDDPQAPPETQP